MYDFLFFNSVKTAVGRGKYRDIHNLASGSRIMLISDRIISTMPFYEEIKQILGERFVCEYIDVIPNPECSNIDDAVRLAKGWNANCIIGIGGGSVLDASKMTAMLLGSEGAAKDYVSGSRKLGDKRVFLVLCPTTAGTGSEVTNIAVITDRSTCKKVPLAGDVLLADYAVVDPCLTSTMPPKIAALTGFDALCHAFESYWSLASTPVSDALALSAIKAILGNLENAYRGDDNAKEEMVIASYMAGLAFNQTRTNICHANSYYLTARYGIDHGTACAITLIPFLRYNYEGIKEKLDIVGRFCGYSDGKELSDAISSLYNSVGMPRSLRQFGVKKQELPLIAKEALAVGSSRLNARVVTEEDMRQILYDIV